MKKVRTQCSLLVKMEKQRQRLTWPTPISVIVLIICCVADIVNFYQLFSLSLENSVLMCAFLSSIAATGIDGLPFIGSTLISHPDSKKMEKGIALCCYAAALLSFVLTFTIRVSSADELFQSNYSIFKSASSASALSASQIAVAVLLGLVPLCTTLVVCGVSYSDYDRKKRHLLKVQRVNLKSRLDMLYTTKALIEEDLSEGKLVERDQEQYRIALQKVESILLSGQELARSLLASSLGSADDCTVLLESENDDLHKAIDDGLVKVDIKMTEECKNV